MPITLDSVFGFLLVGLALLALALQRFYSSVPVRELKRLAAHGDKLAKDLYRAVTYGANLRLLLWLVAGLSMSGGFLLLAQSLPTAVTFLVFAVTIALGYTWLPSTEFTLQRARLAAFMAPPIEFILRHLYPALNLTVHLVNRFRSSSAHSGLYEKEDVLKLLERQRQQSDNRLSVFELDLLQHTLSFTDKTALNIVTPRKQLRLVNSAESLGPVLMGELHESGHNCFAVYRDKPDNIVGTLLIKDAIKAKKGGRVADVMRRDVAYVNQEFSLAQVLEVFLATKQYILLVVNNFKELVGVITLEQIVQELTGQPQVQQDAVNYEDREAVAAYKPKAEPEQVEMDKPAEPLPDEASEVVE